MKYNWKIKHNSYKLRNPSIFVINLRRVHAYYWCILSRLSYYFGSTTGSRYTAKIFYIFQRSVEGVWASITANNSTLTAVKTIKWRAIFQGILLEIILGRKTSAQKTFNGHSETVNCDRPVRRHSSARSRLRGIR